MVQTNHGLITALSLVEHFTLRPHFCKMTQPVQDDRTEIPRSKFPGMCKQTSIFFRARRVRQGCQSPEDGRDKSERFGFAGFCGRTLGSIFQHNEYASSCHGSESVFEFITRSRGYESCLADNSEGRTYQNLRRIRGTVWRPEQIWMNSLCFAEYLYSTRFESGEKWDVKWADAKVDYYIRVSTWGRLRDNENILACVLELETFHHWLKRFWKRFSVHIIKCWIFFSSSMQMLNA